MKDVEMKDLETSVVAMQAYMFGTNEWQKFPQILADGLDKEDAIFISEEYTRELYERVGPENMDHWMGVGERYFALPYYSSMLEAIYGPKNKNTPNI